MATHGSRIGRSWQIDNSGQEPAFCCFGATLRDFGRLGMLLANDGVANGKQIVPQEWVREATQPTPGYPHLKPGVDPPILAMATNFGCSPEASAGLPCRESVDRQSLLTLKSSS